MPIMPTDGSRSPPLARGFQYLGSAVCRSCRRRSPLPKRRSPSPSPLRKLQSLPSPLPKLRSLPAVRLTPEASQPGPTADNTVFSAAYPATLRMQSRQLHHRRRRSPRTTRRKTRSPRTRKSLKAYRPLPLARAPPAAYGARPLAATHARGLSSMDRSYRACAAIR
jgi:hypothetical protein